MADQILGLIDSSQLTTFENWRRAILLKFANGSAPLTAITNLMKTETSDYPKFHWYEKDMPTQSTTLSSSYTDVATTIAVDDAVFRPGDVIKNLTTTNGEVMLVTNVSADGKTLTVLRSGFEVSAEASSGSNDTIACIGTSSPEGSGAPYSQFFDPTERYNYTQIFKSTADVTGTAKASSVKWDTKGPWPEKLRQALEEISLKMEKAFIWGHRAQFTDATTGRIQRTTGGIIRFIDSNNVITNQTTMTYANWEADMEQVFRACVNNRQEKLALCGSGFIKILSQVIKNNATMNLVPKADTFGMQMYQLVSAHGVVYLKTHPLFSQNAAWRGDCLILDPAAIKYRYMNGRDLTRIPDVQLPDEDVKKDMFLAECGLEVQFPDAHMLIKGVTTAGT